MCFPQSKIIDMIHRCPSIIVYSRFVAREEGFDCILCVGPFRMSCFDQFLGQEFGTSFFPNCFLASPSNQLLVFN